MKRLICVLALAAVSLVGGADARTPAKAPSDGWGDGFTAMRARIRAGGPLVVHVIVPLCHNGQVACGNGRLGDPGSLRTNLYWGALYGTKRFFDKRGSGYQRLAQPSEVKGVLERRVYRRMIDGAAWGVPQRKVEQLTVLDAVHGDRIDAAVKRFFKAATEGAQLLIDDGDKQRKLSVSVVGYAGHNRLMDGKQLPEVDPAADRKPIPSFVLACYSHSYFADELTAGGSRPLVMTRALMAPEGYVVEASVRGLADNAPRATLRDGVVRAYAKWQRLSFRAASRLFAEVDDSD